jgi:hypothetical protein
MSNRRGRIALSIGVSVVTSCIVAGTYSVAYFCITQRVPVGVALHWLIYGCCG